MENLEAQFQLIIIYPLDINIKKQQEELYFHSNGY